MLPKVIKYPTVKNTAKLKNKNFTQWLFLALILLFALIITVPYLQYIMPHPDEHQFFLNAWGIMEGKGLHNFLHIALTEYILTAFLLLVNLFVPSGIGFPQRDLSLAAYFFGRVLGLGIYFFTFLLGAILLQKTDKKLNWRTVIFAVLYFGSLGVFERSLRINSDITSVIVALIYLIFSLWLHRKRANTFSFFLNDAVFVFLSSFTNLKALYLIFPITAVNIVSCWFYEKGRPAKRLPWLIRFISYGVGVVLVGIIGWWVFIPRPLPVKTFWYSIKNATVEGVSWDYEYPGQSHRSWLMYAFDLVFEYIGLPTFLLIVGIFILASKLDLRSLLGFIVQRTPITQIKGNILSYLGENLTKLSGFWLFLCFVSYYIGASRTVVHWSRWGVPLGIIFFIIVSPLLEKALLIIKNKLGVSTFLFSIIIVFVFFASWYLRILLVRDLKDSNFPIQNYAQTVDSIDSFMQEQGLNKDPVTQTWDGAVWFTGYTQNVRSISLEKLTEVEWRDTKYVLWPNWNLGVVYNKHPADLSTTNQRAFIDKYAREVTFRFPSRISFYNYLGQFISWNFLKTTWYPETNALIDPPYAILTLRQPVPANLSFNYSVSSSRLSLYKSPNPSPIFNLAQLPDSYMFPVCYSTPEVKYISNGTPVPIPYPYLGGYGRTAGLYCHDLWFRVWFAGSYRIQVEGLPEGKDEELLVYSTQPFIWDPATRTAQFNNYPTLISVEFGVATKEKKVPNLKYHVYYESSI